MNSFKIREADLATDLPHFLEFILGSQHFEHAFEPNRRLDPRVADEHLVVLLSDVAKGNGVILVAEGEGGAVLGWGVAYEREEPVFVVREQRLHGYISELFVVEAARGTGIGRALIAACEDWARARDLPVMMIGVLAGNTRARRIYQQSDFRPYAIELQKIL
jgi:GNAT superfamily N-acetyltransferase